MHRALPLTLLPLLLLFLFIGVPACDSACRKPRRSLPALLLRREGTPTRNGSGRNLTLRDTTINATSSTKQAESSWVLTLIFLLLAIVTAAVFSRRSWQARERRRRQHKASVELATRYPITEGDFGV